MLLKLYHTLTSSLSTFYYFKLAPLAINLFAGLLGQVVFLVHLLFSRPTSKVRTLCKKIFKASHNTFLRPLRNFFEFCLLHLNDKCLQFKTFSNLFCIVSDFMNSPIYKYKKLTSLYALNNSSCNFVLVLSRALNPVMLVEVDEVLRRVSTDSVRCEFIFMKY